MSATYNLKLVKSNFASVDCVGKVRHNLAIPVRHSIGMYV